ncbi:hypothetical protein SCH4B_1235 [Ruegeria sp. TrichCH4B]|nr:hypothetical protein SCH4B_1235 [Ruegeria sp. TrichCH4B]
MDELSNPIFLLRHSIFSINSRITSPPRWILRPLPRFTVVYECRET